MNVRHLIAALAIAGLGACTSSPVQGTSSNGTTAATSGTTIGSTTGAATSASASGTTGHGATGSSTSGPTTTTSASGTSGTGSSTGVAQIPGAPRIFFSDLLSGPNTGGPNDDGAFVTIYGNGFGAVQGSSTLTIGGGGPAKIAIWSNTKIAFQLGAAAATGNIVVTNATGPSNGVPFTVRAGNLYFVSSQAGASDANPGSATSPWATILMAKKTIAPGDIAYLGTSATDAVSQTTEDNYGAALSMDYADNGLGNSGTAAAPKALVAYPGATVTIGDPSNSNLPFGIRTPGIAGAWDHWVIAGLVLRGGQSALNLEGEATDWRIIANDMSCPNGSGETGCVGSGGASDIEFLGNDVHDCATNIPANMATKFYHGVYFGTDTNHVEVGWNTIANGHTCRALQFHSSPVNGGGPSDPSGHNQFDLHVHDNLIWGTLCDGINFATVDPSQGTVEAYDNVVHDVGTGPDPVDGSSNYACIYVPGSTENGPVGAGTVQVYGNTLYNCGSWTSDSSAGAIDNGGGNLSLTLNAVNNLVYALSGEAYLSPSSAAGLIVGSHNLWYGAGPAPSGFTASVTADPGLVSPTSFDFHLGAASSPATGAGTPIATLVTDFDGYPRPPSGNPAIGAYEYHP